MEDCSGSSHVPLSSPLIGREDLPRLVASIRRGLVELDHHKTTRPPTPEVRGGFQKTPSPGAPLNLHLVDVGVWARHQLMAVLHPAVMYVSPTHAPHDVEGLLKWVEEYHVLMSDLPFDPWQLMATTLMEVDQVLTQELAPFHDDSPNHVTSLTGRQVCRRARLWFGITLTTSELARWVRHDQLVCGTDPLTGFNTYRWDDVLPLLARKAGVPVSTTPTPNKIPPC